MQTQIQCPPNHFCLPPIQQDHALYGGVAVGIIIGLLGRSLSKLLRWGVMKLKLVAPKQANATPIPDILLAVADFIAGDLDQTGKNKLQSTLADPKALAYLISQPPETVKSIVEAIDQVAHQPDKLPEAIANLALKGVNADIISRFLR